MQALYSFFQDPLENYFKLNTPIDVKSPPLELFKEFTSKPKIKNFRNICIKNAAKGKLQELRTLSILHWLLLYTEQDDRMENIENILTSLQQKVVQKKQFSNSDGNFNKKSQKKPESRPSYATTNNFYTPSLIKRINSQHQPQKISASSKKRCNTDRETIDDIKQLMFGKQNIEMQFLTETFINPFKKILRKTTSTLQMFKQVRQKYWLTQKLYHLFRSSQNLLYPEGEKKAIYLFNIIFYIRKMLSDIFVVTNKISTLGRYFLENQAVKKTVIFFVDMLALQAVYYHDTLIEIFKSILSQDYQVCFKLCSQSERIVRKQLILAVVTDYLPEINENMRKLLQNKYFQPAYNSNICTRLMRIPELETEILKKICFVLGFQSIVEDYQFIQIKHDLVNNRGQIDAKTQMKKNWSSKQSDKQNVHKTVKHGKNERRQRYLTLAPQVDDDTMLKKKNQKSAENQFRALIMTKYKLFSVKTLGQFVEQALQKAATITDQIQRNRSMSKQSIKKQDMNFSKQKKKFSVSKSQKEQRKQTIPTKVEDPSCKLLLPPKLNKIIQQSAQQAKRIQQQTLFSSPVKEKANKKRKSKPLTIKKLSDSIKMRKNNHSVGKYEIEKQLVIEQINTQLGDSVEINKEMVLEECIEEA